MNIENNSYEVFTIREICWVMMHIRLVLPKSVDFRVRTWIVCCRLKRLLREFLFEGYEL